MNLLKLLNPPSLFLEFSQAAFLIFDGNEGLEAPLDRLENGRLTPACRDQLIHSLRGFLRKYYWQVRPRAFCAIAARGVSLRQLTLPSSSREEIQRLLLLQIEREFPLPPEELAWGWLPLRPDPASASPASAGQEVLVAAVRKEVVEEYSQLLAECDLSPVFTLGAWARNELCPPAPEPYAILDVGSSQSELVSFHRDAPGSIRILPWGENDLVAWLRSAAEPRPENLPEGLVDSGFSAVPVIPPAGLDSLWDVFPHRGNGNKLYLTGQCAGLRDLAPRLSRALQDTVQCEPVDVQPGPGRSAAILGLRRSLERNRTSPELVFQARKAKGSDRVAQPIPWRWVVLAVILAFAALVSRYAEAFLMKPALAKKLAEIKTFRSKLPQVEQELSFLNYIRSNQPPCLDALWVIASSVPPGVRLENLNMSRRGDLSLRLTLGPPQQQQSTEFRSKLMDSGFFSTVVIEEQTPTPDKQKVNVRLTAQMKPFGAREMRVPPSPPAPGLAGPSGLAPNLPPGMPPVPGSATGILPGQPPGSLASPPPGLPPGMAPGIAPKPDPVRMEAAKPPASPRER